MLGDCGALALEPSRPCAPVTPTTRASFLQEPLLCCSLSLSGGGLFACFVMVVTTAGEYHSSRLMKVVDDPENPDSQFTRSEFMEALVRLALAKYKERRQVHEAGHHHVHTISSSRPSPPPP